MEEMTTIAEILEFAIAREVEAVNFYMAMAERVNDPSAVRFFEELVSEELDHKSQLELEVIKEGIVARTVGVLPETSDAGPPISPAQITEQMTYAEALSLAVQKERRSFSLYVRLAGLVTENDLHRILVSLAEQEAKHLMALEEQYNNAMTGHK